MLLPLLLLATYSDLRTRQIPDLTPLIGSVGILTLLLLNQWYDLPPFLTITTPLSAHLWSALAGLSFSLIFFLLNGLGGGDGKLITMLSLSVPINHWPHLILSITILGGLQALLTSLLSKSKPTHLPYALSITLGYITYLFII